MGSNPGRRGGKPATNCVNYGKATPDVLCRCAKQTAFIHRLRGRRRRRSAALLSQSAYTERPDSPLFEEETPLPSSDRDTHKIGSRSHKSTSGKQKKNGVYEVGKTA
jgi:hypothetical protein